MRNPVRWLVLISLSVSLVLVTSVRAQDYAAQTDPVVANDITQITDFLGIGLPVLSAILLAAVVALWRRLTVITDAHVEYLRSRVSLLERERDARNSVSVVAAADV